METYPAAGRGGLAVAPDDTIYVSDVNAGAVTVIKEGKLVDVIQLKAVHTDLAWTRPRTMCTPRQWPLWLRT